MLYGGINDIVVVVMMMTMAMLMIHVSIYLWITYIVFTHSSLKLKTFLNLVKELHSVALLPTVLKTLPIVVLRNSKSYNSVGTAIGNLTCVCIRALFRNYPTSLLKYVYIDGHRLSY